MPEPKSAKYDLTVVLGEHFGKHWGMRPDIQERLDETARLYKSGRIRTILVSDKWAIWYDWLHIKPPISEAVQMKNYLAEKGVPRRDIALERRSKDTIGNIYYTKLFLRRHPEYKNILVICAATRAKRVTFLFHKFFGPDFPATFYPIVPKRASLSSLGSEPRLLKVQREFLKRVRPGHEEDLGGRLYSRPYYRRQARALDNGVVRDRKLSPKTIQELRV